MCLRHEGLETGGIQWQEQENGNHSLPGGNTGCIPDSELCFWFYLVLARTAAESLSCPHHPLIICSKKIVVSKKVVGTQLPLTLNRMNEQFISSLVPAGLLPSKTI